MRAHGWALLDPRPLSSTLGRYQQFIQASKAEFGLAKHGYVVTRSGWFSERSAAYLASGRPVLVQDTGFRRWMTTGEGVIAFQTVDDVRAGLDAINSDYRRHCDAARSVAEKYFDGTMVLTRLLEQAMESAAPRALTAELTG